MNISDSDEVIFIDGVGAGRDSIKKCRDGVQWIWVKDRLFWPLSESDAKRLLSACCGNGSFDNPTPPVDDINHFIAKQMAKIETLQAEIEALRTEGAYAIRFAPSSAYWSDVLKNLFGPNARDGIDALEARRWAEIERADTAEALLRQALAALEQTANALYQGHPARAKALETIHALRVKLKQ